MYTAAIFTLLALAAAAAALAVAYCVPAIRARQETYFAEACAATERADQAEAELKSIQNELFRIREHRHSHQTVEMLEDLSSVLLDVDGELHQMFKYLFARLKNADQILAAGRPGPYSYVAADTQSRPARPGAAVKLWKL